MVDPNRDIHFLFSMARRLRDLAVGQSEELAQRMLELARELEAKATDWASPSDD
jgi:hypothetical protein